MREMLINLSKSTIESVFSVNKYYNETLSEDLERISFLRNLIEAQVSYIEEIELDINSVEYNNELKNYALELFINQCFESITDEEKNKAEYDAIEEKNMIREYFNYIYSNLEYP